MASTKDQGPSAHAADSNNADADRELEESREANTSPFSAERPEPDAPTDEFRPPLPPRPMGPRPEADVGLTIDSDLTAESASKGHLQSKPTTAVSLGNVNTQSFQDGSRETYFSFPERLGTGRGLKSRPSVSRLSSALGSEAGDSASIKSYVPPSGTPIDDGSVFGDLPGVSEDTPWGRPEGKFEPVALSDFEEDLNVDFEKEFDSVGDIEVDQSNNGRFQLSPFTRKYL